MTLKVELKPGERIIIGESMITNDDQRTRLYIEGNAPILREKDILTVDSANTPAKRIYLAVQLMYLSQEVTKFQDNYFSLIHDIMLAAPSTIPFVAKISNYMIADQLYKALKEARALIDHEKKIFAALNSASAEGK
ncbi:flagellar biosynthesis repressor FlbT [Pleomorphomonas sp. PLEO]|uniref:flagellar biosynthesis repressor FlbT n=1 Tax=Pleomorphomonas sp. PLEO TaxID=3239306 RepID=UPI00351E9295